MSDTAAAAAEPVRQKRVIPNRVAKKGVKPPHINRLRGLSEAVKLAKHLFFIGDGNGRRITKIQELADMVGCHPQSIRRYMAEWQEEYRNNLAKINNCNSLIALGGESQEKAKADVEFLRDQLDELKAQIDGEHDDKVKKKLMELFLTVQGRWLDLSGISAQVSAARIYATEQARAKARAELAEAQKENEPKLIGGGFFEAKEV